MRDHAVARSLAFVMVMAIALMPIQAAVAQEDRESVREGRGSQSAALVLPLSGNVTSGGTGTFRGTLSVQRFARKANQIVAVGLITGTLDPAGGPVGTLVPGGAGRTDGCRGASDRDGQHEGHGGGAEACEAGDAAIVGAVAAPGGPLATLRAVASAAGRRSVSGTTTRPGET